MWHRAYRLHRVACSVKPRVVCKVEPQLLHSWFRSCDMWSVQVQIFIFGVCVSRNVVGVTWQFLAWLWNPIDFCWDSLRCPLGGPWFPWSYHVLRRTSSRLQKQLTSYSFVPSSCCHSEGLCNKVRSRPRACPWRGFYIYLFLYEFL